MHHLFKHLPPIGNILDAGESLGRYTQQVLQSLLYFILPPLILSFFPYSILAQETDSMRS